MDEPVWKRYRHMPVPVFLSMTEMQQDALRSIAEGEPLEEWKARWEDQVDAALPRQEPS